MGKEPNWLRKLRPLYSERKTEPKFMDPMAELRQAYYENCMKAVEQHNKRQATIDQLKHQCGVEK